MTCQGMTRQDRARLQKDLGGHICESKQSGSIRLGGVLGGCCNNAGDCQRGSARRRIETDDARDGRTVELVSDSERGIGSNGVKGDGEAFLGCGGSARVKMLKSEMPSLEQDSLCSPESKLAIYFLEW